MSDRTGLDFFITAPHECSYLPDRMASTLFADPDVVIDTRMYGVLAEHGFRRSGRNIYRPQCTECDACISVRVDAEHFAPSRTQRRIWRRNQDLSAVTVPPEFRQEHFELYQRYIRGRHAGGSMDNPEQERYTDFLISPHVETTFLELRDGDRLICVAVIDVIAGGLSAVYTFFDPDDAGRSLGTYAVLWQIEEARRRGLAWVYLGYWIKDCRKMRYKDTFRPFQAYRRAHWVPGETLVDPGST